jgi:hypothetical protein
MKKTISAVLFACAAVAMSGCDIQDSKVASQNLSQDADNFKVGRHISFINTRTDNRIMEIVGLCSIESGTSSSSIAVICKDGGGYKKNIVALSQDVTYVVEQLDYKDVSTAQFKLVIKPSSLIPAIELR